MTILSQNIGMFFILIFQQNDPYIFGHSVKKNLRLCEMTITMAENIIHVYTLMCISNGPLYSRPNLVYRDDDDEEMMVMRMTAFFVVFRSKARRRERKTYYMGNGGNDNIKHESLYTSAYCCCYIQSSGSAGKGGPERRTHLVGMTMGGGKA